MPATGGGRAVHAASKASSKRNEKAKSVESMQAPPRESAQGPSSTARPGLKGRAYSTPIVPKNQGHGAAEDNASLYSQDGEEIANDAFFQRYHFPQPVEPTKEEVSDDSRESSSDTEGPLSPTHIKNRQPAVEVAEEPSSGVGCFWSEAVDPD
jgi:hypothetical protein